MNIICCSGGNDSVALIQWAKNKLLKDVTVLYNKTGLEAPFWFDRLLDVQDLCNRYGFNYVVTTPDMLFKDLIINKKGFPMAASNMSWCTLNLKTIPTLKWLEVNDPMMKSTIYTGVRREESINRKRYRRMCRLNKYKGRRVERPLVGYTTLHRNELIRVTKLPLLSHKSQECFPCINSNRNDLRLLSKYPERIEEISDIENILGFTKKGKPKVMFRPYRHMGATGIEEVVDWALAERGRYR